MTKKEMNAMYFDDYDSPVFRPPSEAYSFILRLTRGCAHNRCTYCNMYRGVPFQVLSDEDILRQIEMARVYGRDAVRRVFFADGDALVLSTDRLLRVLATLRETFPNFERASSYAAPKDILRKSVEELRSLQSAGLRLLYYGMESGDTITLQNINKGVDGRESIEVGQRVIAAEMQLSLMVILGIAGVEGSERHALETAKAVSAIRPSMLSALSLMLYRGSELKAEFERGEFHPLPPAGLMRELHLMMTHIDLPESEHCLFRSNHVSNYVQLKGALPKDKPRLLAEIAQSVEKLQTLKDWDVYNHDKW